MNDLYICKYCGIVFGGNRFIREHLMQHYFWVHYDTESNGHVADWDRGRFTINEHFDRLDHSKIR